MSSKIFFIIFYKIYNKQNKIFIKIKIKKFKKTQSQFHLLLK